MSASIFISYRRDDSEGFAGRIRDRLVAQFGEDAVFTDINSIPPGADFQQFISDAVKQCRVMLVLIDRQWLTIADASSGERRLDRQDDFVRLEIAAGLENGLTVIPVLLRGTPMPTAADLPNSIKALASRNAQFIQSHSFASDVQQLIRAIRAQLRPAFNRSRVVVGAGLLLIMAAVIVVGIVLTRGAQNNAPPVTLPSPTATMSPPPASPTAVETSAANPGFIPITRNFDWQVVSREFSGVIMVLVPEGCFSMGSNDGEPDEQPVHQQCFNAPFWIDRTEVTNRQFGAAGSLAGDDFPRDNVNWAQASDSCARRGARLATEAEWEYAARGPDGIQYPWGNAFVPDFVIWHASQFDMVGGRDRGASWVGALDLSGNLWEWVSSWYASYPYVMDDGREAVENVNHYELRVTRGGSWFSKDSYYLRSAYRYGYDPLAISDAIGFRCVRSY